MKDVTIVDILDGRHHLIKHLKDLFLAQLLFFGQILSQSAEKINWLHNGLFQIHFDSFTEGFPLAGADTHRPSIYKL